jgi:hypothetical protein
MTDLKHNNGKEELLATVVFATMSIGFGRYIINMAKPDVSKTIHEIKNTAS